jgi:hypothetical protein
MILFARTRARDRWSSGEAAEAPTHDALLICP